MDQFLEGLTSLGILDAVKSQPDVMKPLFVAENSKGITAGNYMRCLGTVITGVIQGILCFFQLTLNSGGALSLLFP